MKKTILFLLAFVPLLLSGQDLDTPVFDWAVQMGGNDSDEGRGIATDHLGNVFVTGSFRDTADFDPGPEEHLLISNGGSDIFVAKYLPDGNLDWAYGFGDTLGDWGTSIKIDESGDVFVVGHFYGVIDFDPGVDSFYLPYVGRSFVLKLSNEGNFIWVKRIGGAVSSQGNNLAIGIDGSLYITGSFFGTYDFDPGFGVYEMMAVGDDDIFVLKLDNGGGFIWSKSMGGESDDIGLSIALDSIDNVYTVGYFLEDGDFDPSPNVFELGACGDQWTGDVFISKLNSDGDFMWAKNFGSFGQSFGTDIVLDKNQAIYVTGYYEGTIDFNCGVDTFNLTAEGTDPFVLKLDITGNFIWAGGFTGSGGNSIVPSLGVGLTVDDWKNVYTIGIFLEITDFDPSADNYLLATNGGRDVFLSKLRQQCTAPIINITESQHICYTDELSLNVEGGETYLWSNSDTTNSISVVVTIDETYTVTVTDAYGCTGVDSVMVSVFPISDTTFIESLTCDSTLVGEFLQLNTDQNGCDSIVMEQVFLDSITDPPTLPSSIVIDQYTLSFTVGITQVSNASAYIWTVPSGVQILSGQGTDSLTVIWDNSLLSGSICVSAINECDVASPFACLDVVVEFTDQVKNQPLEAFKIYPNPVTDMLYIQSNQLTSCKAVIIDQLGRYCTPTIQFIGATEIDTKFLKSGVYWLKLQTLNGGTKETISKKVVVIR